MVYNKILITGGAGMIGSNIARKLSEQGREILIFDDLSAYPFDYRTLFGTKDLRGVTFIEGSILDTNALNKAMKSVDSVIHAAAYADVAACVLNHETDFNINVYGTNKVLESALKHGIKKFVFISSASVYGENKSGTFCEGDPLSPISTYGNSKMWGEQQSILFSNLYNMPTTAVRYFSVYGSPQIPKEGSHSWCVAIFAMLALKKKPITIFGDGSQVRDFTHVVDIAEATIRALDLDSTIGHVFNVGTGNSTPIQKLAEMILHECGSVPINYKPHPKGDPNGGYADTNLMKQLLNWEPKIKLENGVAEYCDWIKQNVNIIPDWI